MNWLERFFSALEEDMDDDPESHLSELFTTIAMVVGAIGLLICVAVS